MAHGTGTPHAAPPGPTQHGTCVAVGETGVLIRGPSGSGKSTLALRLMLDAPRALPPAQLVADDRVLLAAEDDSLIASPPAPLAGLIEVRGLGLRRVPHLFSVKVKVLVDLAADDAARLPTPEAQQASLYGIRLFRIAVPAGADPALLVAAAIATAL
ncbi:HPr kinase/phosphorylase [Xanthobacteraceae bacterium A53D]